MANDDGGHVPDYELRSRYRTLLDQHSRLGRELTEMVQSVIIDLLREVLPGASAVEVHGQINEDWLSALRVQRALDETGTVLFDVETGHPDRAVEDLIDRLDTEFLDHLVYLAPDAYLGHHTLGANNV